MICEHVQTRLDSEFDRPFLPLAVMHDPDTIELALELGLHPDDFSMRTSDPFADDSGVAFPQQNQYQSRYDDFQDDIGDYTR
jgi:hypothetical protein